MKRKQKIIFLVATIIVILSLFFFYYLFLRQEDKLSIEEKKWIDNNKNDVIDISVLNEVFAFTYNGNGVLFDFLTHLEKETNLSFNPSSFKLTDTVISDYYFTLKDKANKNDLVLFNDNYVLVNLDGSVVSDIKNINNNKIGVLKSEQDKFSKYFNQSNELTGYDDTNTLFNKAKEDNLNAIIILKNDVIKYLSSNDLKISYQFSGETKSYVLTLNGEEILNSIIRKYFKDWYNKYFNEAYNNYLLQDYFAYYNVSNLEQTNLRSKTYIYGFVEDGIYDKINNNDLVGINNSVLKSFAKFSKVAIEYKKYNNIDSLLADYENGKIDIMFNNFGKKIEKESYYTKSSINSKIVVLSPFNKDVNVLSIGDLTRHKVLTVKNSKINKYLKDNNIKAKQYKNIDSLLNNLDDNTVVTDLENFEYYKTRDFKNYKVDAILDNINYNYIINNSSSDATFAKTFDFYINYIGTNKLISDNYGDFSYKTVNYFYLAIIAVIFSLSLFLIIIINKVRKLFLVFKDNRRSTLTKEEKLKYIDQLTSLKNRAYLNSKVETWDESEVYPQCIIVVDLNNIAYINDNYGREEGDKIILQAANILITSQLSNTEIIRTDGNEFLIYLVGYPEKTIIAYIRKLTRMFKSLDHGFGAAIGYSMITDAIKTFDDAVNEATIDMRNNKDGN